MSAAADKAGSIVVRRTWDVADVSGMSEKQKTFAFLVMALGMFVALLDIQIVASSVAEVQAGLAATSDEISKVQTWYLVAEVIIIPLAGWLSRIVSTRWLFTASAAGFTAASAACAFAWNIDSMIVFRALQGFFGGAMIPTTFATGFVMFPKEKQARFTAILGLVGTCAPALGPTIGGYITTAFGWRWLFFINLFPGVFIVVLAARLIKIDKPNLHLLKYFDLPGVLMLATALGCLQYVLDEGPRRSWFEDGTMLALSILSITAGIAFIWRSLHYREPIVDLRAFQSRNFSLGCIMSMATGVGLYGMVYLSSLFLSLVRGWDSLLVGKTVFLFGLSQLFAAPVISALSRKVDARHLLIFGYLCQASGTWMLCGVTSQWGFAELLISQILRGVGAISCLIVSTTVALGNLKPEQLKSASGLFNLMRNLGGAIGLAVLTTLLFNNRFELHYDQMVSVLNERRFDTKWDDLILTQIARGSDRDTAFLQMRELLSRTVAREALVQSFADMFLLVGFCFFGSMLLVLLVKKIER
ncbi:MAG TPA: DHA2 family efflux MFS transporter permease subunit [Spongiibacteraceae bacterium]|jgi:DHA2 family multidrug resistance protein